MGLASSYLFVIVQYDKVVKPHGRRASGETNGSLGMKNAVIRALSAFLLCVPLYTFSALVHGSVPGRNSVYGSVPHFVFVLHRTDFGYPHASMRLRTEQPMATSVR